MSKMEERRNQEIAHIDKMRKQYKQLQGGVGKSDLFMDIEHALTQLDIDEQEDIYGKTTIRQRKGF